MSSNLALLAIAAVGLIQPSTGVAATTDYPDKPITVVVAFPPGAPEDFIVRLIADPFQATMKQPLIAENHAGAGGNIGAELVSRAATDGYTLLATIDTVVTINPALYRKLSFKPESDLRPVIYLASTAQTLVCHPSVPVKTVADLIGYAKTHSMNYASGGQGTPGHMAMELFMAATATRMNHIPYKGPGPATQDILAGVVPCGFLATPVVMPHVRSGKLTALGVTSSKRMAMAPEIATIAESGVPGYEASFGQTLLAPRGTPDAIVKQLNAVLNQILQRPDVRDRMLAVSLEFTPNSPDDAAARLKFEALKWHSVIDRLGLLLD